MTRPIGPSQAPPRLLLVSTTWWPSDARLAASLRDAGCAVSLLCPGGHPAEALGIEAIHRLRAFGRRRALLRAIRASCPDLVVPTDERALRDMHELHASGNAATRALIENSLGAPGNFARLTSRLGTMEDARQAGMRVADTIAVTDRASLRRWKDAAPGPIVLKSDGSWGGEGVRVCHAPDAVDAALRALRRGPGVAILLKRWLVNRDRFVLADRLRRREPALVAQRHVAGRAGDLAAFCYRGELLGVAIGRQEQCGRLHGPSTMLRLVDHPALVDGARRLAASLGLTGFIGIDIIIEDATGEPVVIEINPRATPLAGAARGACSPAASAARALGAAPRTETAAEMPRDLVAYFPAAWRVDPSDERLEACDGDIPHADPALLAELLRTPWPERGLLARIFGWLLARAGTRASSPAGAPARGATARHEGQAAPLGTT